MRRFVRGVGLALVCASSVFLVSWAGLLLRAETPAGLRVAGQPLPSTRHANRALHPFARQWLDTELRIAARTHHRRISRRAAGLRIDLAATTERVERVGRSGLPWRDIPDWWAAWMGRADVPWVLRIDDAAVQALVQDLARSLDRPPRAAQFDERGRLVRLSSDGLELRQEQSRQRLAAALRRGRTFVRLPVGRLSSGTGVDALPAERPSPRPVTMARYQTTFDERGRARNRAHNVLTAAGRLDGAVIDAGQRLSFNERVGPRTRALDYRIAGVIVNGEMVDGMGGGVCQVASTLHAAALMAGLDVVEQTPHSRPSGYIPMGLDATVVWPDVDLVVVNPYPFPLRVRARAAAGNLVIELLGRRGGPRVELSRRTLETEPWEDRFVEDEAVAPGQQRVSQRGIRGFTVVQERTVYAQTGVRVEARRVRYPPTDRIVRVSPGALDSLTGRPSSTPVIAP